MAGRRVTRHPGGHRPTLAWDVERIADAARLFFELEGRAPTARDWAVASEQHPSHVTVTRVFRGRDPWRQLRVAAGLEGLDRWTVAGEMLAAGTGSPDADELERAIRRARIHGTRADYIAVARCAIARAATLPHE